MKIEHYPILRRFYMSSYTDIASKLDWFQNVFLNSTLPKAEVSDFYDLFPTRPSPPEITIKGKYPQTFPFSDRKGVYIILDSNLKVLYIGKASFDNFIGNRLGTHFIGKDKCCSPKSYSWTPPGPRYVISIAVPKEYTFMASSLEEYLIAKLQPTDNKHGKIPA